MSRGGLGRLAASLVPAALLLAGCANSDTSLYVANHTGKALYLAVEQGDGMRFVAKVADGADGLALSWEGGVNVPVSVLDLSCTVVGTFGPQSDGTFAVAAVPSLTAKIESHGTGLFDRLSDAVAYTDECGGEFYH